MSSKRLEALRAALGAEDQAYQAAVSDFDAAVAAALGINRTDLRCLEVLFRQEARPSQLANELGLTTGSVTAMLDRLERQGYLTRAPDGADRRKVVVQLTAEAVRRVWTEIYEPLVTEGLAAIAGYRAADLTTVTDYLRRSRELYERHLARLRNPRRT